MLSSFQVSPLQTSWIILLPLSLWGYYLTHPPTPVLLPWHSPTLGHRTTSGPRVTHPTDVQQGHPLPHMRPEPWVPPCVLLGWWSSPWELQGVWSVDTVAPSMGLHTLSAPSVPSTTPPLRTNPLQSNVCLRASDSICQALAEPLRRQPYQFSISKHFWHPQ